MIRLVNISEVELYTCSVTIAYTIDPFIIVFWSLVTIIKTNQ